MTLKEIRAKHLRPLYDQKLAQVKLLHEEIGTLIESGDFSLARMKTRDLERLIDALNVTANDLADIAG